MEQSRQARNIRIDILKGIAIIAVLFYHLLEARGVSWKVSFGYLGVDIFFVVSGYLTAVGILTAMEANAFSYWKFLLKRFVRCNRCGSGVVGNFIAKHQLCPTDLIPFGR